MVREGAGFRDHPRAPAGAAWRTQSARHRGAAQQAQGSNQAHASTARPFEDQRASPVLRHVVHVRPGGPLQIVRGDPVFSAFASSTTLRHTAHLPACRRVSSPTTTVCVQASATPFSSRPERRGIKGEGLSDPRCVGRASLVSPSVAETHRRARRASGRRPPDPMSAEAYAGDRGRRSHRHPTLDWALSVSRGETPRRGGRRAGRDLGRRSPKDVPRSHCSPVCGRTELDRAAHPHRTRIATISFSDVQRAARSKGYASPWGDRGRYALALQTRLGRAAAQRSPPPATPCSSSTTCSPNSTPSAVSASPTLTAGYEQVVVTAAVGAEDIPERARTHMCVEDRRPEPSSERDAEVTAMSDAAPVPASRDSRDGRDVYCRSAPSVR